MAHLTQGRIVRASVTDRQGGNPKVRPIVVLTDNSEIGSAKTLVGAAITSQFVRPLQSDEVPIPFSPDGTCVTKLRKDCVAKCSWLCEFEKSEIVDINGPVPTATLEKILAKVSELRSS